jgi:phosphoribosylformimino-5-aminoimidazole carboxamide ribotide isomerase
MRIIGVVDLLGGRSVHAVGGVRATYVPVRTVAGATIQPGDARALAEGYRDRLGVTDLYCADLDAIACEPWQEGQVVGLAGLGLPVWLDAGVSSVEQAERALALGASHVVAGLETLPIDTRPLETPPSKQMPSFAALQDICRAVGREHVAFSLDLRHGVPIGAFGDAASGATPWSLAARAAEAGATSVIVLDLARVGTGAGLDLEMIGRVRDTVPSLMLVAGGGVRDAYDLRRLADAGCDGALVATALHDGRLSATDIAAAHALSPRKTDGR